MFFKSIRFKILLWYMLLLTLTLFSFSVVLYGGFSKSLYDDLDDLLSSRAEGVADSINAYWHAKKMGLLAGEKGADISQASDLNSFLSIAKNWVEEKRKDPDLMSIFVQILDTGGTCLVTSKSTPHIAAIPKDDFKDVLDKEDSFNTVKGKSADGKEMKFRVYTKPVIEEDRVAYIVQVAGPMGLVSLALNDLMLALFVVLPLMLLLAGIPGILLAQLTLRPVDNMIKVLRQITAENLKLRIHMPDTKDAIKRLADAFNSMIERLDRSFSSQHRFIQDVSRELKTPMNSLKDELAKAAVGDYPAEENKALLLRASKELDGFSGSIKNLLALSQFADNQVMFSIKKIDIAKLVEQVLKEKKPLAMEKEIAVSYSPSGSIKLDGDEDQLRQLFANLLDNAVKYTYRKGKILVTVRRDEGYVLISVSDTGSGIPEDEIEYIFDRFYQAARPRGLNHGFGLGLSQVKSIVEAHKGTISVESRPGEGSTFTISLPIHYPV